MATATLRALMAQSIDYAGLFPPASLSLRTVARNFAAYRLSSHAWALGRLVVPASRLAELADVMRTDGIAAGDPWAVTALIGADSMRDGELIRQQNAVANPPLVVETAELRVATPEEIDTAVRSVDRSIPLYVEFPVAHDPQPYVETLARLGARAKIRTGGITSDAFPTAVQLARFIRCCVRCDICFKATAGLHHPVRGDYPLTGDADAPRAPMFGFLNILLTASFARNGMLSSTLEAVLEERDAAQFVFSDDAATWRGKSLSFSDCADARRNGVASFGSCSFREPIDDLHTLGLL